MCVWAALVMEWVVVGDHAPRIPGPASCAYICLAFFYLPPPPPVPFSSVGPKLPCHLLLWQVERVC